MAIKMIEHETFGIPSLRLGLLCAMLGCRITKMVRRSYWAPLEVLKLFHFKPSDLFSLTAGCLEISLDTGLICYVDSEPGLISVVVGSSRNDCDDGWPIEAGDDQFCRAEFRDVIGEPITRLSILRRDSENPRWESRPREVGVVIALENGPQVLLSHGLHNDSDDFSVLIPSQVELSLRPRLTEFELNCRTETLVERAELSFP